jgi:hypothetical protein
MKCLAYAVGVMGTVLLIGAGCATTQPERSEKSADSLDRLEGLLDALDAQLAAVDDALAALATVEPAKLRKTFRRFEQGVNRLEKIAAAAEKESDSFRQRGEKYFDAWGEDLARLEDDTLRVAGTERRRAMQMDFDAVIDAVAALQRDLAPLSSGLSDLRIFLGNDLTRAGAELSQPHIRACREDDAVARGTLRGAFDRVRALARTFHPR